MDSEVREICTCLNDRRKALVGTHPKDASGQVLLKAHSDIIDETLKRLYAIATQRAKQTAQRWYVPGETEIAIVATGGYGRRELSPFSDVDIAFIPSAEDQPYVDALVKHSYQLITEVFVDHSDLNIGYAYRPLGDCPRLDHQTKTSLLDMRLVAGHASLVERMRQELLTHLDVVSFLQEKSEERHLLLQRYRSELYSLEPNLKGGSGGLRDLQSALWMAQVMFRVPHEQVLHEMVRHGVITPRELQQLVKAREFLWRIRNWLHLTAGRKNDVILSDLQDRIAADFGYVARDAELLPSERFMADYYIAAETLHRISRKSAKGFLEGSLSLGRGFVATRQRIAATSPDIFHQNPALTIVAFELAHRYGFVFDLELEVLLDEALPLIDDAVRSSPEAAEAFLNILTPTPETGHTLRKMRDRNVLSAYLPEFGELMHHIPADPAHELTVGEHSLRVIDYLLEVQRPDGDPRNPVEQAFQEINDPELLMLAALLHDVGKLHRGADHATEGAEIARVVGKRLHLTDDRIDLLTMLIREHLTLVRLSRLRDLNSPVTIREAMQTVRDRQTLKMLYLLSYADTRAVGTRAYTEVDMRLLDEVYLKVNRAFCDESAHADIEVRASRERARVRTELTGLDVPEERVQRLAELLPASYVVNTPLGLIATHIKLLDRLESEKVVVDFYSALGDDFTELTVCAYDDPKPGMLSKITGTLYANDVDIRTAQVFTLGGQEPIVLDTLWIAYNALPLSETKAKRLGEDLRRVLSGAVTLESVLQASSKPVDAEVWVQDINARNDISEEHTVVDLVAGDVKGLLYFTTRAIAQLGLAIHTAKITTWAGRAEDAFYVTRADGSKIPDEDLEETFRRLRAILAKRPVP